VDYKSDKEMYWHIGEQDVSLWDRMERPGLTNRSPNLGACHLNSMTKALGEWAAAFPKGSY
jgi:hypothetical protein